MFRLWFCIVAVQWVKRECGRSYKSDLTEVSFQHHQEELAANVTEDCIQRKQSQVRTACKSDSNLIEELH